MQAYSDNWGAPADFKIILEQISSEDIMFVYEGVSQLRNSLSVAQESTLSRFPLDSFCQRLVQVIKQPSLMDISNEIKHMAIQCIVSIMDIFPSHINHFIQYGTIPALYEAMEQSMGFVDLAEQCIKCCEKMSQEHPREILKSGILLLSLNMIDFFDKSTQLKIIQLLLNVSAHSESEADFKQNLLPIIPNICQMLNSGVTSEQDRAKFEKLSTVVARVAKSFTLILNPIDNFEQIAGLFERLSDAGLYEAIYECICTFSNYVFATMSGQQHQGYENQSQTLISTDQSSGKQTFTDSTICNFLSVLQISCQYSQQVVMQLTSAGIFEILQQLLPTEQQDDHSQVVIEVLGLLSNMLPASEAANQEESKSVIFETGFGQKIQLSQQNEGKVAKFNEIRGKVESEKEAFFKSQDPGMHNQLSKVLLPKIFAAYIQNINNDFRTKCLTLIQRTLFVIPKSLLNESFDPASFTKFIHMILRTHQPQQVLCCLRMILQMLETDFGAQLSIYFIRHGIRETIKEYTLATTIQKLNEFEVKKDEASDHPGFLSAKYSSKSQMMQLATSVERERLAHRTQVIQSLMESSTGAKRDELARVLSKYEETIKMLESKSGELSKESEVSRDMENAQKTQKIQFGEVISELAQQIQTKYIDNEAYWAQISQQHPEEANLQQALKQLASDIITDAKSSNLNFTTSQNLMHRLASVLTSPLGLTNFEFENSGLLKAITVFLTMSPYDARLHADDSNEETKQNPNEKHEITKQEAISLIMRLKLFAQEMCTKINNKLPFKCLLGVCHEQLTLAEPIIFKDQNQDYQGQLEALNNLSRGIIINLVYDPDGKFSGNSESEHQPSLLKAKSEGLPFQNLQADNQKSILFHKRHALYEKLKQVPLNIQQCDNILVLEDFLLKRIRSKEDVQSLIDQTRPGAIFGRHNKEKSEEVDNDGSNDQHDEEMSPGLQEVYDRCMERLVEFIEECVDQGMFGELCPAVIAELVSFISDSPERPPDSFFTSMEEDIANLIKDMAAEDQAQISDEEMNDGEESREQIIAEIVQAKTAAFLDLIRIVKEQTQSHTQTKKVKKPTGDTSMEDLLAKSEQEQQVSQSNTPVSNSEDVEMTEENPSASDLKSSSQSVEMADTPVDPVPQKLQPNQTNHPIKPSNSRPINLKKEAADEPSVNIADLLKQTNGQDIQIVFYNNKKQIDKTTSFYEICKEPLSAAEGKQEGVPSQIKDLMAQLTGGFLPGQRTIYFQIRDYTPALQNTNLTLQRKDSLFEYSQIRQRTKSQFVDEISASSINHLVQTLIQHEFGIQSFGKASDDNSLTLEQTLKVMKVLNFIFTNSYMFTQQGVNFLLHRSIEQPNQTIQDLDLINLHQEVRISNFHHPKLDSNLQKAIQDPYKLVSGGLKEVLKAIFSSCAFLFNFETKQLYLRLVSFISVDLQRSMFYLRQHMKKTGKLQLQKQSQLGSNNDRDDRQPKIQRQKIKVDRQNIVQQALAYSKDLQKRAFLEIQFSGEEGTGLGPTLEFYSLLSEQLKADQTLWRKKTMDGVLYPKGLSPNDNVKEICEKFYLAGVFVARSIIDDRLMDLPISQLMWDILLQKKKNLFDLKKLDTGLFEIFQELQVMANRKQEIDDLHVDHEMKQRLYAQVKSSKGAKIEDYNLYFYDPSDEEIELVKDGKQTEVTLLNLQEYIDLVLDSTFNESVRLQIAAFKKGFNQVMPVETLRIFQQSDELETLICGEATISAYESEWTNATRLSELINTAHGYHQKSRVFKDFLRYLNELAPKDRALFLSFITGSPRLPVGGFGALEPRMTVVLKKPLNPSESPNSILPSVMTCQNYVKMPDYTSYEILKQRFDYAIHEGKGSFTLS